MLIKYSNKLLNVFIKLIINNDNLVFSGFIIVYITFKFIFNLLKLYFEVNK